MTQKQAITIPFASYTAGIIMILYSVFTFFTFDDVYALLSGILWLVIAIGLFVNNDAVRKYGIILLVLGIGYSLITGFMYRTGNIALLGSIGAPFCLLFLLIGSESKLKAVIFGVIAVIIIPSIVWFGPQIIYQNKTARLQKLLTRYGMSSYWSATFNYLIESSPEWTIIEKSNFPNDWKIPVDAAEIALVHLNEDGAVFCFVVPQKVEVDTNEADFINQFQDYLIAKDMFMVETHSINVGENRGNEVSFSDVDDVHGSFIFIRGQNIRIQFILSAPSKTFEETRKRLLEVITILKIL